MSIPTGLPASVLAQIPAANPPDGTLPNFKDPPSIGPAFVTVGAIVTAIMMVFVLVRFYAKIFIVKKMAPDDCEFLGYDMKPKTARLMEMQGHVYSALYVMQPERALNSPY